jgi:hypothetical protein
MDVAGETGAGAPGAASTPGVAGAINTDTTRCSGTLDMPDINADEAPGGALTVTGCDRTGGSGFDVAAAPGVASATGAASPLGEGGVTLGDAALDGADDVAMGGAAAG